MVQGCPTNSCHTWTWGSPPPPLKVSRGHMGNMHHSIWSNAERRDNGGWTSHRSCLSTASSLYVLLSLFKVQLIQSTFTPFCLFGKTVTLYAFAVTPTENFENHLAFHRCQKCFHSDGTDLSRFEFCCPHVMGLSFFCALRFSRKCDATTVQKTENRALIAGAKNLFLLRHASLRAK